MKKNSISHLKKILYEETFPLDWNTLDISDWETIVHQFIEKYGWEKFFLSSAFSKVIYPKLVFTMMKNGFDIDIPDQDFEKVFVDAMKLLDIPSNTMLMKDFVGLLKFNLAGKEQGQVF